MTDLYKGSCLCGSVKYELSGVLQGFFLCYCSRCRKDSGSAYASNLFARSATLTWLAGAGNVKTYRHPGTLHVKSFCQQGGSALPVAGECSNDVVVPAGSLDSPVPMAPTVRIFIASRAAWASDLDSLPGHDALPPSRGR